LHPLQYTLAILSNSLVGWPRQ